MHHPRDPLLDSRGYKKARTAQNGEITDDTDEGSIQNRTSPWLGPMRMTSDAMRAVEMAASMDAPSDFEHEHAAPTLQAAVARAVTHGIPIKDVATAARMTALEVLDAADP